MKQYPDILIREDSTELPCRFVPAKGKGITKVKDGAEVGVSYTIAFPVDTPQLLIGEVVSGKDGLGEYIIYQDTVALFHRGQLHCIAYV